MFYINQTNFYIDSGKLQTSGRRWAAQVGWHAISQWNGKKLIFCRHACLLKTGTPIPAISLLLSSLWQPVALSVKRPLRQIADAPEASVDFRGQGGRGEVKRGIQAAWQFAWGQQRVGPRQWPVKKRSSGNGHSSPQPCRRQMAGAWSEIESEPCGKDEQKRQNVCLAKESCLHTSKKKISNQEVMSPIFNS